MLRPSHHTSPSLVCATLVKMVLALQAARAEALVVALVPLATPKNPASGLMATSLPSLLRRWIQAMSSPDPEQDREERERAGEGEGERGEQEGRGGGQ